MDLKVIYSCPCRLVLPKNVIPGTMRVTSLHVHFIGDVPQPPDDSSARYTCPEPTPPHPKL